MLKSSAWIFQRELLQSVLLILIILKQPCFHKLSLTSFIVCMSLLYWGHEFWAPDLTNTQRLEVSIDPFHPKSDQNLVSPDNNTAESFILDHEN